jgi:hypothetical protein
MVALTPALLFAAAAGSINLGEQAAKLKAASGIEAINIRNAVIAAAPSSTVPRNDFAKEVDKHFRPLLSDPNPDARLNSIMLFVQLETLATDAPLAEAVSNNDPAVRYWGAKGLGGPLSATIIRIPNAAAAAVKALADQAKRETSGVVQQEILKALVVYKSASGVLDGLEPFTNKMQTEIPDRGDLDAVSQGLDAVGTAIAANPAVPAPQKERAAIIAARAASFAAQQLENYSKFETVPEPYAKSVRELIAASVKVLSAAGGQAMRLPPGDEPGVLVMNVNALVGRPGEPGELQKRMPNVLPPPRVGPSATRPATAPAGTGTPPPGQP